MDAACRPRPSGGAASGAQASLPSAADREAPALRGERLAQLLDTLVGLGRARQEAAGWRRV